MDIDQLTGFDVLAGFATGGHGGFTVTVQEVPC